MSIQFVTPCRRFAAALLGLMLTATALADPPAHAPAHGWRKKHDPEYVGYTGREWPRDYGVVEGTCNRRAIGTVLGAAVGGAIGSQIGEGTGRTVAIIVGSVLGAVIGREIGRDMDEGDRGCFGHGLELVEDGRNLRWLNESTGVNYVLTPLAGTKSAGKACRNFTLKSSRNGKSSIKQGRACRSGEGVWSMQS